MYKIIQSDSKGNAVLLHGDILIDIGVSYKKLTPYVDDIKYVLLTHHHSDHYNKTAIRKLSAHNPSIEFYCGEHLYEQTKSLVSNNNVFRISPEFLWQIGEYQISPIALDHINADYSFCQNYGYRVVKGNHKTLYATDTDSLDNVSAKDYDLYMIEGNYCENVIYKRMEEQELNGEFTHGKRSIDSHLSIQQRSLFILMNAGVSFEQVMLHKSNTYGQELNTRTKYDDERESNE